MAHFVFEIRWRFRMGDAEPSSNFEHKLFYISDIMNTPSMNLQPPENSFEELTKCSAQNTHTGCGVSTVKPLV